MLLKNLMEEKQLDFNQPLLSVRKFGAVVSTTEEENKRKPDKTLPGVPSLPVYRSELKSGPVRNPGTVPFIWEQTPGKPKDESKPPQNQAIEWHHPLAPKLPPGRILNAREHGSDKHWHGRAASQSQSSNDISRSQNAESLSKYAPEEDSSKQRGGRAGSSGSEGCDEVYVDAFDTLSLSESFFLNCSMNSVVGLDGPNLESSRTFSTDPHTRDFMIDRFLPAAKAMASETPQYHHTRKLPVAREQPMPRKVASVVKQVKQHPVRSNYRSNNIPHYAQVDGAEEVSDDEDDDCEGPYKSSFSVCGLFPRLCPHSSLGLLNPVPGMRKQAQVSSFRTTRLKSSHTTPVRPGSCIDVDNELDPDTTVYKPRSMDRLQTTLIHKDKRELKTDEPKLTTNSKTGFHKVGGSSLYKGFQGNDLLPSHSQISKFSVKEEKGLLGMPEAFKNSGIRSFGEWLADVKREQENGVEHPPVEKTVYIDSIQSSCSDKNVLDDCTRDDDKMLVKDKETDEAAPFDPSYQDVNRLNPAGEKPKLAQESWKPVSFPDRSIQDVHSERMDGSGKDKCLLQVYSTIKGAGAEKEGMLGLGNQRYEKLSIHGRCHQLQDSITVTGGKLGDKHRIAKASDKETSNRCHPLSPLPPPLPKSPSESWLIRTLPSVSSKHSSTSRPSLGTRATPGVQASKTHSTDPKWETIVRTSNVQLGLLRFSEERLTSIPET